MTDGLLSSRSMVRIHQGGVSNSNGSERRLGAVFILCAQTGDQNAELSSDSRTGFNMMNGLPVTAAVSEVLADD